MIQICERMEFAGPTSARINDPLIIDGELPGVLHFSPDRYAKAGRQGQMLEWQGCLTMGCDHSSHQDNGG